MFGRNKNNSDETSTTVEPVSTTPGGKKGRPTPKRKQAEAARLHPLVPADRKGAKRAARAARNARWEAEQRALVTGDEKHLPARDKGSARRFVRDYVDARHSFSEWVLLVMMASIILIMILSLFGNTIPEQTQIYILYGSTILMYGSFIVTGVEAMLVWLLHLLAHDHAAPLALPAPPGSTRRVPQVTPTAFSLTAPHPSTGYGAVSVVSTGLPRVAPLSTGWRTRLELSGSRARS